MQSILVAMHKTWLKSIFSSNILLFVCSSGSLILTVQETGGRPVSTICLTWVDQLIDSFLESTCYNWDRPGQLSQEPAGLNNGE